MQLRIDVEEISEDLGASPGLFMKQQEIRAGLEGIINYLQECEDEYEKHHNDVIHDPHATNPGKDGDLCDVVKQRGMTWMQDFMKGGKDYKNKYITHLTKAKGTMRSEVYGAFFIPSVK
jgi:hypothetical protein